MNKKYSTIKIGDLTYHFNAMPAEKQYLLSLKVGVALGGACASALPLIGLSTDFAGEKAKGIEGILQRLDLKDVGEILSLSVSKIDPEKVFELAGELMEYWQIVPLTGEGYRASFDSFRENMGDINKVLLASIRYYFEDFIKGLLLSGKAKVETPDA